MKPKKPAGINPNKFQGAVHPEAKMPTEGVRKNMNTDYLHKALGVSPTMKLHPPMLKKLVSHPDPKVSSLAKSMLSKMPKGV